MAKRLTTALSIAALSAAPLAACGSNSGDGAAVPGINDIGTPNSISATTTDPSVDVTTPPTQAPTTPATTAAPTAPPTTPAPTAPPPTTDPPREVEYLRQGDEGPRIATMQRELIALDLLPPGADTGVFDAATNSALLSFQGQWGLLVDGVFGPETDRALTAAAQSVARE